MYLIDTNVISELRKSSNCNTGVAQFFQQALALEHALYISVITIGELRRGIDRIRYRGDRTQADKLEAWLQTILTNYAENILDFAIEEAQAWGRLRVPHAENAIDKQIAATALIYDFTVVTRNVKDFAGTGVKILNPFV